MVANGTMVNEVSHWVGVEGKVLRALRNVRKKRSLTGRAKISIF